MLSPANLSSRPACPCAINAVNSAPSAPAPRHFDWSFEGYTLRALAPNVPLSPTPPPPILFDFWRSREQGFTVEVASCPQRSAPLKPYTHCRHECAPRAACAADIPGVLVLDLSEGVFGATRLLCVVTSPSRLPQAALFDPDLGPNRLYKYKYYTCRLGANPPNTPTASASACAPTESGNSTTATSSRVRVPSNDLLRPHAVRVIRLLPRHRPRQRHTRHAPLEQPRAHSALSCRRPARPLVKRILPFSAKDEVRKHTSWNCDVGSPPVDDEQGRGRTGGRVRVRAAHHRRTRRCAKQGLHTGMCSSSRPCCWVRREEEANLQPTPSAQTALGRPAAPSPSNPRVLPSESYPLPRRTPCSVPLLLRGFADFADLPPLLVISGVSATLLCIPATPARIHISYISYSESLRTSTSTSMISLRPCELALRAHAHDASARHKCGRVVEGAFQPAIWTTVRRAPSPPSPVHQGGTDGCHAESIPLICTRVLAQDAGSSARAGRGAARRQWCLLLDNKKRTPEAAAAFTRNPSVLLSAGRVYPASANTRVGSVYVYVAHIATAELLALSYHIPRSSQD
ncbi:hypothetical protein C8R44DRAFT_895983 [Mycena epipterygia]|nr:hypothetical protein C8R44DRAFT_895983 [Mycena epipterygia]